MKDGSSLRAFCVSLEDDEGLKLFYVVHTQKRTWLKPFEHTESSFSIHPLASDP